jgi:polyphosphate glucokinase
MKILVLDVGGNHVKLLASGQTEPRRFESGPALTASVMVEQVKALVADWEYEAVSLGYPGPVRRNRLLAEPHNLGPGWVGFDFEKAFGCPVKIVNDAAMQALGSYRTGAMLFLGLGTGLGSAMIIDGGLAPMELAHLPYRKRTYEGYTGQDALDRMGRKKWRKHVAKIVSLLAAALEPEDVVLGGGNIKYLKEMPSGCRAGNNAAAFEGGFRLWAAAGESDNAAQTPARGRTVRHRSEVNLK